MNRCKTCKWWDRSEVDIDYPPDYAILGLGHCTKAVRLWEAIEWDEDNERRFFKPGYDEQLSFTQDGSQYRADLYTRPDFGCVHHEEKARCMY